MGLLTCTVHSRRFARRPVMNWPNSTGMKERYLREWLSANVAGGYIDYDSATQKFSMTPEQAIVFAAEGNPHCMQGFFQAVVSGYTDIPKATDAIRSGSGLPWGDHSECLFCGTERFFRPMYAANLVDSWIPALDGMKEKLESGAKVADVGCGHGSSTIIMAQAFPNSTFHGFDFHAPSIEHAREHARAAGVASNTIFEVTTAKEYPGENYDMVAIFDALHDMGDPVGASKHVASTLAEGGTLMLVEPFAEDSLEGQFASARANLLLVLDNGSVCTQFSVTGGWAGTRCPGW